LSSIPVFTAHPTEARRKAVEGKIRRISELLAKRATLAGVELVENERLMLQEIDALVRTSPIAYKKPTPCRGGRHSHRHLRRHALRHGARGLSSL
jgi:phosphoenolpyruvate carboxylase